MRKPEGSNREIYRLKVTLREASPRVWHEVEVPASTTLSRLHLVLQEAFGWENYHLHEFRFGNQRFGDLAAEDEEVEGLIDERIVMLGDLITARGARLQYLYDFGDGWDHELEFLHRFDPEPVVRYPRAIAGEGTPKEDCGGIPGFERLVEILSRPRHREHREMRDWAGPGYDPLACDLDAINQRLRRFAPRAPRSRKQPRI